MEINFNLDFHWQNVKEGWNRQVSNQELLKNVVITSENEKARFDLMINLVEQMSMKLLPFSTLFINLNPDFHYSGDFFSKSWVYGSQNFSVPYYLDLGDPFPDFFPKYVSAILDFHPELECIARIIQDTCQKEGFPPSILQFLEMMRNHVQEYRYDEEFNNSLLKNLDEAEQVFKNDDALEKSFRNTRNLPDWISDWQRMERICIDLSQCDTRTQQMLVAVIFYNLVKATNFASWMDYWYLNGVVMINDASTIFAPVLWDRYQARYDESKEYWDDLREVLYYLTKEQWIEACGDKDYFFKT